MKNQIVGWASRGGRIKQLQSVGTSIVSDQEPQWCDWFILPRFACVDFDIWLSLLIVFLNTKKKKKKSQPPGIASRLTWGVGWIFHYHGLLQVYQFFSVFGGKKRKGIPLTKVVVGVHRQPTMIPELKVFCNGFCLFCASPVSVRYISEMFDQRFFLKFYKELIIIIIIIIF